MTYYLLTIVTFIHTATQYIPVNLKKKIPQSHISYLDMSTERNIAGHQHVTITFYYYDDIRDDFNFYVVDFLYFCSNLDSSPAYGVFVPKYIRYARICFTY